jgi:hypothetical protein
MTIRYEVFCRDCKMEADMYGDYVQYSDYENLEIEYKLLKYKHQALLDRIVDICREDAQ